MLGNPWNKRILFNAEGGSGSSGGEGAPAAVTEAAKGGAGGGDDKGGEAKPVTVKDEAKALNDALGTKKSESDPGKDDGKGADGAKTDDKSDEQKEGEDAKDDDADKAEGAPEGDYQPFTLPEGREASPEAMEIAVPLFKKLNLNQESAQEVVDAFTQVHEKIEAEYYGEINDQFDAFTGNPEWYKNGKMTPEAESAYGVLRQVAPDLVDFAHRQGGLFHPDLAKVAFLLKAHYGEADVQLGDKAKDNAEVWRDFYDSPSTPKT